MRLTKSSVCLLPSLFGLAISLNPIAVYADRTQKGHPVELTFAFFGCNRIDGKDWEASKAKNPSSANVPQLRQNLADIAKLAPEYVFFGGDLVMGYANDKGEVLRRQMTAWFDLVKRLPKSPKSQYIAISGNHELNRKIGEVRLPNPPTDAVWSSLVRASGFVPSNLNGPTPQSSPDDKLVSDQKALSFSFNRGPVHFVILNTDTRVTTRDSKTGETKIGMVPAHWLENDLEAAEKDDNVKCVVVMGHRNVVTPKSAKGESTIDPECGDPMIKSLKSHSKVRAYICAHVHAFDITNIGKHGLKQLVFGNGGSRLEPNWNPKAGRTFGFGYFKVYSDGSLGVVPYFRPEPKNYQDERPDRVPQARPLKETVLRAES